MALKVGDLAPDFELPAVEGEQRLNIKLSDFRGKKNVVVSFHPLNWTPTCSEQLPAFDSDREKFAALNAQLLDISVDSVYSHMVRYLSSCRGHASVRHFARGPSPSGHQRESRIHRGQKWQNRVCQSVSAGPEAKG
jgi:alkyl hydroperoxide reductase subunit AhpC